MWYCSFASGVKEVSGEIDENGQSAEVLTQWSARLTSLGFCAVELFAMRVSMVGQ